MCWEQVCSQKKGLNLVGNVCVCGLTILAL